MFAAGSLGLLLACEGLNGKVSPVSVQWMDTVGLAGAFVTGYVHDAAAPVCGETRVFHLITRN
jgi:hypothetical protein